MADSSGYSTSSDDTGAQSDRETAPGMPRWITVSGIVAIVVALVVVLIIVIMIMGMGNPHEFFRNLHSGA